MKKLFIVAISALAFMFGLTATGSAAQFGGDLKILYASAPKILGYSLEQGPTDLFVLLGAVEKVVEFNDNQELVPHLARSVDIDDQAKTITIQMRRGIKFHDGSDCDAEAIAWNYEQQVSNKRIGYISQFKSMRVIDKYTLNGLVMVTTDLFQRGL